MSSDWQSVFLSEIANYSQGIQVIPEDQFLEPTSDSGRFVRIIDYTNPSEPVRYIKNPGARYSVTPDDIVMIRYGSQTAGKVVRGISGFIANNLFKVNLKTSEVDAGFLYRILDSKKVFDYLRGSQSSSTMPAITFGMMDRIELRYPSISEQRTISAFFDSLDDRIALLRETNATLEAIAQALFKSWFVDFDPVHANAGTQAPSLPPEIQALFPATFTDSPHGPIPEGWTVSCLSEICQIASGKRPEIRSDVECEGAKVPLYGGAGVMGYTDKSLFDLKKILTGRVGTLGKVHIATPPFWASDNVLVLTPKDQSNFYFSLNWLLAIDVHSLNRGSTQPLLTQKDLGAQQRALPPNEVLIEFDSLVAELYLKIQANSQQAQTLATLRDTLLPRLISGKLRLPDAQAILEEDIYAAK
ncbi:restriction endonuclease subunit S [Shewanella sp. Shew256]|uniref:restriction endonuclease subunit S n=1 Tax=Shewanella sp. Shew256 TaxID=1969376 RepID=UPI000B49DABF|nr:restriction endonuclease subunit S [Shewanella sp. Shew256]